MNRNKVGIVTLYGQNNYGNRLQNYATVKSINALGYSAESLVLTRGSMLQQLKSFVKNHFLAIKHAGEVTNNKARLDAFHSFSSNIPTRIVDSVNGLDREYRYFSVGSDQVWNPRYIKGMEKWFYLQFCKPKQRIALSPSIGLDELNPAQCKSLSDGIRDFPRLSIREHRGAELIAKCAGRNATVLCDPTLTVSSDEWDALSNNRLTPSEPYVFAYVLGDTGSIANVLETVTRRGIIPVISLSDRATIGELPAGPAEFVSLIENAKHVVTDSFHAAVFAAIFQKPLTVVKRDGGADMFSRLDTLSMMLDIRNKIFGSAEFDYAYAGDYVDTSNRIELERHKFMAYLSSCLELDEI